VRVHIAQLRKFLRESPTCCIQNVPGVGYRFTTPSPESLMVRAGIGVDPPPEASSLPALISGIDVMSSTGEAPLQFGPFRWLPDRQRLLKSGHPVPLSPRVAAILAILLERPGALVLKREIRRRAWPTSAVGDSSLRACVAALRKVLHADMSGTDCVQNVMGHGYRLVLPIASAAEVSGYARTACAG
jgi:DNA-binding winged helix-turn-helix (wHTH) protein